MWAEGDAWTPAGGVPVRWVTSDALLPALVLPPDAPSLLCEECEARDAVVWSEDDSEALCAACCLLLYPRATTGRPHANFLTYRVRVVSLGDKSRALRLHQVHGRWLGNGTWAHIKLGSASPPPPPLFATTLLRQTPDFFSQVLDEAAWSALGRDLRHPSATEAPKINPINGTSRSNRSSPKFCDNDVVVFDVEDYLPVEVSEDDLPQSLKSPPHTELHYPLSRSSRCVRCKGGRGCRRGAGARFGAA
jgi:hypothetical protein